MTKTNLFLVILMACSFLTSAQKTTTFTDSIVVIPENKTKNDLFFVLKHEICFKNNEYGFYIKKNRNKKFIPFANFNSVLINKNNLVFLKVNFKNSKCIIERIFYNRKTKFVEK